MSTFYLLPNREYNYAKLPFFYSNFIRHFGHGGSKPISLPGRYTHGVALASSSTQSNALVLVVEAVAAFPAIVSQIPRPPS